MEKWKSIGNCGNYYGGIMVCESDGKYYMGVGGHNGIGTEDCDEIPKYLYTALVKFEDKVKVDIDNPL